VQSPAVCKSRRRALHSRLIVGCANAKHCQQKRGIPGPTCIRWWWSGRGPGGRWAPRYRRPPAGTCWRGGSPGGALDKANQQEGRGVDKGGAVGAEQSHLAGVQSAADWTCCMHALRCPAAPPSPVSCTA
jgi:hypothetical protein